MKENINTKTYWDSRFSSGDWEEKKGCEQTSAFASEQVKYLNLSKIFCGVMLDFGCGLGDAIPIYNHYFPLAKLKGIDHSKAAIIKGKERYGNIAEFIVGDEKNVPDVDIIISSNVFEHLSNYLDIAEDLVQKCNKLYIFVPYNEDIISNGFSEHINSFNIKSFSNLNVIKTKIYKTKAFKQKSILWVTWNIHMKNFIKYILNRNITKYSAPRQIMYVILGNISRK